VSAFWEVTKIWAGNTAFIIGGGPSLAIQAGLSPNQKDPKILFPAIAEYLSKLGLNKHRVIGVNDAFRLGDDLIDVAWFTDCGWFDKNFVEFARFAGLKAHICSRHGERPGTHRIIRKETSGISTDPKVIHWNGCSGSSAINLAYLLGARRVILIAFDMQFGQGKVNNWHAEHKKKRAKGWNPYPRFLKPFITIAQDAKELGLEIINANPDSALDIFPKMKLEDVIHELESSKTVA